jgi:hypothetical protein
MTKPLESWYRRLIAVFPAGHRAVYAEDMIQVLMDDATEKQSRPTLSTTVDLLKGAASAWALRLRTGGRTWRRGRSAAGVALLALLMMSTQSITGLGWILGDTPDRATVMWVLPDLIWLPVGVIAVAGLHRTSAGSAWAVGVAWPVLDSTPLTSSWVPDYLGTLDQPLWLLVAVVAAAGLSVEGGTRRSFQALGRSGSACALLGTLLIGLSTVPATITDLPETLDPGFYYPVLLLLAAGLILLIQVGIGIVTRPGSIRTVTTVAVLGLHALASAIFISTDPGSGYLDLNEQLDTTLPLTLVLCLFLSITSALNTVERQTPVPDPAAT